MKNTAMSTTLFSLITLGVVGCSSSPDKIGASYVSPLQYQHYKCDQIKTEILKVNSRVIEVSGAQQSKATQDAVATGVGLVLFWPALFFLATEDHENELARLKGEYEALETAAIEKKCSIAPQLEAARKEREEARMKNSEQFRQDEKSGFAH